MHEQPAAAAPDVLPVLDREFGTINALVNASERAAGTRGQRLVELELAQLARAAERADEPAHWRAGNGPPPRSSSMCPVAKRDKRKGLIRSGAQPVATKVAQAAPEAGMVLKPP